MARAGDDGVCLVGGTLAGTAGMSVDIRDDRYTSCLTEIPEFAEVPPIEMHDARIKSARVEIVIEQIVDDTAPVRGLPMSKKEGTAFAPAMTPGPQVLQQAHPQQPRT